MKIAHEFSRKSKTNKNSIFLKYALNVNEYIAIN